MKEVSKLKSSWRNDKAIMTIKEQVIYINLVKSCFSSSEITNISVRKLATDTHYSVAAVEQCLDSLVEGGFILRQGNRFKIVRPGNYEYFFRSFLGVCSATATAVAFRLASCRSPKSSFIQMKDKDIIELIGISKPTFTKAKKELMETGVLNDLFGDYQLSTNYFPLLNCQLSDFLSERSKQLLLLAKQGDKAGQVYAYYAQRDFKDLKFMSPDKFLYWCEAGCPKVVEKKTTSFGNAPYEFDEEEIDAQF